MRLRAKRDESEDAIVRTLRQLGWNVAQLSGCGLPDLIINKGAHWSFVECKSRVGKLTPEQVKFHTEWKGLRPLIFRDAEDAIAFNAAVTR